MDDGAMHAKSSLTCGDNGLEFAHQTASLEAHLLDLTSFPKAAMRRS